MKSSDGAEGSRHRFVAQLVLALILSFSALVQFSVVSRTTVEIPLRVDAGYYFPYAYNLTRRGVYSISRTWDKGVSSQAPHADAFRPPGYPLFLAGIGTPEPTEGFLRPVSLVQAALGVLSVWLVYLVARHFLGAGGSLAAALTALSLHLAVISTYLLSESLFFFLLLFRISLSLRSRRRQDYPRPAHYPQAHRWPFPRYGIPFRPLLYVLAMLPLTALHVRWKRSNGIRRIAASIHPSFQGPSD